MKNRNMLWSYLLMTVLSAIMLGHNLGCDTVKGAGKDTEHAGDKIQDMAEDAKH